MRVEEMLKKPSGEFRREIQERTGAALGEESPTEGTVEVWGVIKVPGASSTGISAKPIAEFPLSEVYGYSRSAAVLFMSEASEIAKDVGSLQKMSSEDVDAEIAATSIWHKVRKSPAICRDFLLARRIDHQLAATCGVRSTIATVSAKNLCAQKSVREPRAQGSAVQSHLR